MAQRTKVSGCISLEFSIVPSHSSVTIQPEERLATTSEPNPAPNPVTDWREAGIPGRNEGCWL
uniref:Uncharacterized protein n=1 Tax=Candidatus Methanogaster sp. ANME-2c ERB4 TaxID=2759911 RepID=A0A7G9YIF2_9EURY|nr:hypothetical protein FMEMAFBA_00044 [Methanosarcinales archaeon ANME-2c ERB4]